MLKGIKAPKYLRKLMGRLMPMWRQSEFIVGKEVGVGFNTSGGCIRVILCHRCSFVSVLLPCQKLCGIFRGTNAMKQERITHQMLVNDLKIYKDGERTLEEAVEVAHKVASAVGM